MVYKNIRSLIVAIILYSKFYNHSTITQLCSSSSSNKALIEKHIAQREHSEKQFVIKYNSKDSQVISITEKSETKKVTIQNTKIPDLSVRNSSISTQSQDRDSEYSQSTNNSQLHQNDLNTPKSNSNQSLINSDNFDKEIINDDATNIYGNGNYIVQKYNDYLKDENFIEDLLQLQNSNNGIENYIFCRIENKNELYIVKKEQKQNMLNEINIIKFEDMLEIKKLLSIQQILKGLLQINELNLTHKNIYPERIIFNEQQKLPLQLDITDQIYHQDQHILIQHSEIQPPEFQLLSQESIKEQQIVYCLGVTIILSIYGKKSFEQQYQVNIEELSQNQDDEISFSVLQSIYMDQLSQKNYFPNAKYSPGFFEKIWYHIKKFFGFQATNIIFNFKELILQMIQKDPQQRLTLQEISDKIDQFIQNYENYDINFVQQNVLLL